MLNLYQFHKGMNIVCETNKVKTVVKQLCKCSESLTLLLSIDVHSHMCTQIPL